MSDLRTLRPLHLGVVLGALVASVALAPAAAHAQSTTTAPTDSTPRRTGLTIPGQVADFTLRSRRTFPERNAGLMLRYAGPDSLQVDVFLYPGPGFDAACDSACSAGVLTREVAGFHADFPAMLERGYYRTIDVASDSALIPPPGAAWRIGRHVQMRVSQATGAADQSDYVVFYLPHYRVKLRATYHATPARVAALQAFTQALLPAITTTPPSPTP